MINKYKLSLVVCVDINYEGYMIWNVFFSSLFMFNVDFYYVNIWMIILWIVGCYKYDVNNIMDLVCVSFIMIFVCFVIEDWVCWFNSLLNFFV